MVRYCYEHIPYYHYLFKHYGIDPTKIRRICDLSDIPILTKKLIRKYYQYFQPYNIKIKHTTRSTGGTTGTPLSYRIDNDNRFLGAALLYRGWSYAGYSLGDKLVHLGGRSINIKQGFDYHKIVDEKMRNMKKLSSFNMSNTTLGHYIRVINKFKPKFIRGYSSALFVLANYCSNSISKVHSPKAIFTTSEKLYPHMRKKIESVFESKVFDGYGLNDGCLSAFECVEKVGMHINTERSIHEIVSDDGQIETGHGSIIATSLFNYSMPFLRYHTGDYGTVSNETCPCGRKYKLLTDVDGRSVDILYTPSGERVHGWVFLYLFWEFGENIIEYQVVQNKLEEIDVYLITDDNFNTDIIRNIEKTVYSQYPLWRLIFHFPSKIPKSISGKYRFIKNNLEMSEVIN